MLVNDGHALPTEGCGRSSASRPARSRSSTAAPARLPEHEDAAAKAAGAQRASSCRQQRRARQRSRIQRGRHVRGVRAHDPDRQRHAGRRRPRSRPRCPRDGTVRKNPDHPGIRDGDFENGIICHEYGHGVSNRLTGGPGKPSTASAATSRWARAGATTSPSRVIIDPALDDPDLPRGMGPYALFQADRHGAGIRPRPYTRDMSHPAVHVRQHQDERLAERDLAGPPARPRPRLGRHALGSELGPHRQARVQPEHLRGLEHGRQQPRAPVRDRRDQDAGLRPRPRGRQPRRSSRPPTPLPPVRTPARSGRRSPVAGSASAPSRGRTNRNDNDRGVRHASELPRGLHRRCGRAVRDAQLEQGGRAWSS